MPNSTEILVTVNNFIIQTVTVSGTVGPTGDYVEVVNLICGAYRRHNKSTKWVNEVSRCTFVSLRPVVL